MGVISKLFSLFKPKKATHWPSGAPLNVRKPFGGKGDEVRPSGASARQADQASRREQLTTVDEADWTKLNSTNVDRIRYGFADKILQVIFKNGMGYYWRGVEPTIFIKFLQTHSPGQYVHYVLHAYYGHGKKFGSGFAVSPPRPDRFSGLPFAVPAEVEALEKKAGRGAVDDVPVAQGVRPSPLPPRFFTRA